MSYGLIPSPIPVRDYDYETCVGAKNVEEVLPDEFILPEEYIPPVYDQLNTMKCVSFAMCESAESNSLKQGQRTAFSTGWNYGRYESRKGYRGAGLFADTAMRGAIKIGFIPDFIFDFDDDVTEILKLADERDDLLEWGEKAKPTAFASLIGVSPTITWNNIKRALAIDNTSIVLTSNKYFGEAHAILGIGYSNNKNGKDGQYLVIQNSWGKEWGDNGRDKVPLSKIDKAYVFFWKPITLPFVDVNEDDWFFDEVKSAYLTGMVQGKTKTTFCPDDPFIRGDIAVIISRLLDKIVYSVNTFAKTKRQGNEQMSDISFLSTCDNCFTDIKDTDYYYSDILKVCANGIMNGTETNKFSPKDNFTRAEASAILVRLIETLEKKLGVKHPQNSEKMSFTDVVEGSWYTEYVDKAHRYGLMNGKGDGKFAPEEDITRAEGATIFNRVFKSVETLLKQL